MQSVLETVRSRRCNRENILRIFSIKEHIANRNSTALCLIWQLVCGARLRDVWVISQSMIDRTDWLSSITSIYTSPLRQTSQRHVRRLSTFESQTGTVFYQYQWFSVQTQDHCTQLALAKGSCAVRSAKKHGGKAEQGGLSRAFKDVWRVHNCSRWVYVYSGL